MPREPAMRQFSFSSLRFDRLTRPFSWLLPRLWPRLWPRLLIAGLLVVLVAFLPAKASEDLTCGGTDLVARLERDDPAAYARFMSDGEKIENGQSIFWRLEKKGVKPSYLLGTFHVTDPRVTAMPQAARQPFVDAQTLILESDEIIADQKVVAAKLLARPDLMMFSGKASLHDYLSDEEESVLEQGMSKRGIPLSAVIKMKPWLLSPIFAMTTCEMSRKASGVAFLDMKLGLDAKAAGKKLKGLESMEEQLQAMADLPIEFHVRSLVSAVRYPSFTNDMMETATQLYLSGRASQVIAAALLFNPDKNASDGSDMEKFEQRMIIDRNHVMATRAGPILAEGNVFMAVGAAHLPGPEGLVALFRKQGFSSEVGTSSRFKKIRQ